jgi:hypothetical protein
MRTRGSGPPKNFCQKSSKSGKKLGNSVNFGKIFPLFGQRKKHGCNYLGMARLGGRGHAFFCELKDNFFPLLARGVKKFFVQGGHPLDGIYEVPGNFYIFDRIQRVDLVLPIFGNFLPNRDFDHKISEVSP